MKRIAVVGCGAIASSFHLPVLAPKEGREVSVVLVDPDQERARAVARRFKLSEIASSHEDLLGELDGAVIATPHNLHVPIGLSLVKHGISILSEKPLATSVAEIQQLEEAASRTGAVIAVNQTRRFIPACREIHRRIQEGELGAIRQVRMDEGDRFGWPSATPAMFGARSGGAGVLLDIGVHALDLASWWLPDEMTLQRYQDDSFGGSEAAAHAVLRSGTAEVELRLSWLAKRPNRYTIEGDLETVTWEIYDLDRISVRSGAQGTVQTIRLPDAPASFEGLAPSVISDFLAALEGGPAPAVTPRDAMPSMQIIEACYASRDGFSLPWQRFQLPTGIKG